MKILRFGMSFPILLLLLLITLLFSREKCSANTFFDKQNISDEFETIALQSLDREYKQRHADIEQLSLAKFALINGDSHKAKAILNNIKLNKTSLQLYHRLLLAKIAYLEGDAIKALAEVENLINNNVSTYQHLCFWRMALQLQTRQLPAPYFLQRNYQQCSVMTEHYNTNDHLWMDVVIRMNLQDDFLFTRNGLSRLFVNFDDLSDDVVSIWLKLALFFNKEKEMSKILKHIRDENFDNPLVRELMGLIYYRLHEYDLAESFMEDLSTPNAENVRGNLALRQQQLELAYGHFQLALRAKSNSRNAVEKLAPLSWILDDYENGIEYAKKLPYREENESEKYALVAAFLIANENFTEAQKFLDYLDHHHRGFLPQKVIRESAYNALRLQNNANARKYAEDACLQKDSLSCLLFIELNTWPELSKMIEKEVLLDMVKQPEWSIEELKKESVIKPLQETVRINQNDIIELDDRLYDLGLNHQF